VQNSPTADLLFTPLNHFCKDSSFEFMLFAEGPVDSNHPPAADIAQLFEGRLTLFDKDMSAALQVAKFREAKLHALITVAGWTYGHLAEVLAALGSCPHPIPVINWLGWSGGLMYMPEAVHYTIAGQLALSTRQRLERGDKRERIAQLSCYQPYQGHPSHRCTDRTLTRKDFNLPSCEESFIYCFDGTTNRIDKEVLFCWLRIVFRVHGSVLLLLHKPIYMRARIM
jgi:predicted O-linked N-acetylglucosamine transferase (SPINDLY family)